ncbi:MAG: cyclic nucleotide-binding domain-containing protein [Gammaproteobacteria bacterium]|nr:cyclic nucleotide-binding domain-containing protein [Gammaproteobacteria bacterium]
MSTLEDIIRNHPFFAGIGDAHISLLSGCAKNARFSADALIFAEGNDADAFYCIRQGTVLLEIHAPQRGTISLETREEGDIFGWSWLVPPYKWSCDARATEAVRALVFDGHCLRGKIEDDAVLGRELYRRFMSVMHRSLKSTRLQLLDVYGKS